MKKIKRFFMIITYPILIIIIGFGYIVYRLYKQIENFDKINNKNIKG